MGKTRRSIPASLLVGVGVAGALVLAGKLLVTGNQSSPAVESPSAVSREKSPRDVRAKRVPSRDNAPAPILAEADGIVRRVAFPALLAGIESIAAEADGKQQRARMENLVAGLSPADLPEVIEFLRPLNDTRLARDLLVLVIRRWAEFDLPAAAHWVGGESAGRAVPEEILNVALIWSSRNLAEAIKWVQQFPEESARNGVLVAVAYEASRVDPVKALSLAVDLPKNAIRDDLINHAAIQLASTDPDIAAGWAEQIENRALRQRVLASIASAWGASDPGAAANLAVRYLEPGRWQDQAVVGILQHWAQKQPEEAARWVAGFPEGSLRDAGISNVVRAWPEQNLAGLNTWLHGLQSGSVRDVAVAAYIDRTLIFAPDLASGWAETIQNEAIRSREIQKVAQARMGARAN